MAGFQSSQVSHCGEPEFGGRWNHELGGDRYTLYQPGVSDRCGGSCPAGARLYGYRRYRDAKSETCRSPSPQRDDLFLVSGWSLPDRGQPGCRALGGGLPLVCPGSVVVCGGLFGPPDQTAALAPLGQASHHRHGSILRFASDRFLRGQRQEPAALERASSRRILAIARSHRNSPDRPRSVVASAGASTGPALIKNSPLPAAAIHISIILEI